MVVFVVGFFVGASLRRFFGSAEDGVQKPFRKPWFGTFNMLFAGASGGRAPAFSE